MREILFRGKRTDNGEWIQGFYVFLGRENHCIFTGRLDITRGSIGYEYFKVDPETVGQFTGLIDKNGIKIFEGDIIKTLETDSNGEQRCFPVIQSHGAFWLYDEWLDDKLDFLGSYEESALEVIGNIHDNPKLLKGT